ncbi:MAG TPA: helix-turn-helix transcriptional regulator [Streptosporangiaceae bacterium]
MNEESAPGAAPEWDLADRMRKALRHAGIKPSQMADYLGVGGNTVSTWINGRIEPSTQTLRLWSLRCGVPFEWLSGGRDPRRRGGAAVGFKSDELPFAQAIALTLAV